MPAFDDGRRWISVATGQPIARRRSVDLETQLRVDIEAAADELVACNPGLTLDSARRSILNTLHLPEGFQ
jgi:hypothetical protein